MKIKNIYIIDKDGNNRLKTTIINNEFIIEVGNIITEQTIMNIGDTIDDAYESGANKFPMECECEFVYE